MSGYFKHPKTDDLSLPRVLHALGDPVRLRIAQTIYRASKPLTCSEAVENIDNLAISTRSHCFKLLRESGVLHSDKQGREHYNIIRTEELEEKFPGLIQSILS